MQENLNPTRPANEWYKPVIIALQVLFACSALQHLLIHHDLGAPKLAPVIFYGFLIFIVTPLKFKKYFFTLLFLVSLYVLSVDLGYLTLPLFGLPELFSAPRFSQLGAAAILGACILIIGILLMPVSARAKGYILIVVAIVYALMRIKVIDHPIGASAMAIIGAIFFFRIPLWLHEKRHGYVNKLPSTTINYFMMFPNLLTPLFPLVDFKQMDSWYRDDQLWFNSQKGVKWMVRGILHLMLYRILYTYFQHPPEQWTSVMDFFQFLIVSWMLILQLSGIFQFVVGIICLFGYNLPPVFYNFFLASGFSDLWRRANIYWRDYMQKLFYYPLFFRFRKYGYRTGIIISVMCVFLATWLLHQLQWFWTRGDFPITLVDGLFWLIFGILVTIAALRQWNSKTSEPRHSWRNSAIKVAQIIGFNIFISFLWSFWRSPTVGYYIDLLRTGLNDNAVHYLELIGIIAGVWVVAVPIYHFFSRPDMVKLFTKGTFWKNAGVTFATIIPLVILSFPQTKPVIENTFNVDLYKVVTPTDNEFDQAMQFAGYYEGVLQGGATPASQLLEVDDQDERAGPFRTSRAAMVTNTFLEVEIRPSVSTSFKGEPFISNQWGMRDKEYTLEKPDNTYRMTLVGGSIVMGSGVGNDDVFEALCETKLNNSPKLDEHFEIMNFSVAAYQLHKSLIVLRQKMLKFHPDAAIVVTHSENLTRGADRIIGKLSTGVTTPLEYLNRFADSVNLSSPDINFMEIMNENRLKLAQMALNGFAKTAHENGIKAVWVFLPSIEGGTVKTKEKDVLEKMARKAGFDVFIDLTPAYANHDPSSLQVSFNDRHPNAEGHQLLAAELYKQLMRNRKILGF